jgi:tetratricopeptide (TPR) repeat protein
VLAADYAGLLTLLDSARKEIWQFELGTPITTVACSRTAAFTAYAVDGGRLGVIGMDGSRIWEASLPGEVAALAVSADGALTAALYFPANAPEGTSTVALLLNDGTIGWTHDTDRRATGVSFTPDGSVLSVGARDGSVAVYRVEQGAATGSASVNASSEALTRAAHLEASGDIRDAYSVLQAVGPANPADVALWQELTRLKNLWFEMALAEAESLRSANDYRGAIRCCAQLIDADPLFVPAIDALRALRTERAEQLRQEARSSRDTGNLKAAEAALREAVAVALPEALEMRRELADICAGQATAMDARADAFVADGRLSEALEALQHAQSISLNTARSARITQLQVQFEFAAGMEAYNARKYAEAAFQFKKVLNLQPTHAEARRYQDFARKFAQDSIQESLADRFSRLE